VPESRRDAALRVGILLLLFSLVACTGTKQGSTPTQPSVSTTTSRGESGTASPSGTGSAAIHMSASRGPSSHQVDPSQPVDIDIPGVGRLTGDSGSVETTGEIVVSPVEASATLESLKIEEPLGVDISVSGTKLLKNLTLEFHSRRATPPGKVPVVLHKNHAGEYDIESPASRGNTFSIATNSFSPRVFGFIDIQDLAGKIVDFIEQDIASGIAGRTSPLTCSGGPKWLDFDRGYSSLVHVCATGASGGRGEIQIKSNRGVSLQLSLPSGADYVWVENQPWEMRKVVGSALGIDPNRTVILPAGARMTVGLKQPQDSGSFIITASPTGGLATADTWLGILVDYIVGSLGEDDARIFIAEAFRQCSMGQGSNFTDIFSTPDPGSLRDFGVCFAMQVLGTFEDETSAIKVVQRFGGNSSKAAELASRAKKVKGFASVVSWGIPALQASIGTALDSLAAAKSEEDSYKIEVMLTGHGSAPPSSTTQPPRPLNGGNPEPGTILINGCLDLHDGVGHEAPVIDCIPQGTVVDIQCTAIGNSVPGYYSDSNIWDRTSYNGKTGFAADAWIYTGTDGPAAPACQPAPAEEPTTSTEPPATQPPPTTPETPSGNPPFTGGYAIADSFFGGTWPRTDPNDGTWYSRDNRPTNAASYWWANGLGVGFSCGTSAAPYVVSFQDGHQETWSTWLRSTDTWGGQVEGLWIPSAVADHIYVDGMPPGLPQC